MNKAGRIENSFKNSILGVIVQIINILLGLVVRTVFIYCLNAEYLGVNGLFSNILTILSLAEMGVGSAIIYNMYRPIAEDDYIQIARLMNFYRKAYTIIGVVITGVGLCLIPVLDIIIIDKPNIEHLEYLYLLYLTNTAISYFFAYKRSIFSADQRERVLHVFKLLFYCIRTVGQILVLILIKSFELYLIVQIICTLLENLFVSLYADIQYPFLKDYKKNQLSKREKRSIFIDIKALFIYKVGSIALDGTDNIIISVFEGVAKVGLLSNYTLITGSAQMLLSQVMTSITGSVGSFIAREDRKRYEELLNHITFLNYILYGGTFVILTTVLNTFIELWAGKDYVLGSAIVFVHCLNVYIFGMMNAVWSFRTTMGLFVYGKYRPLISALINIVVSIILAKSLGLIGILLGTTITRVLTNVWYDPYIVYKYGLKVKPVGYYLKWMNYLIIVLVDIGVCSLIIKFLNCSIIYRLVLEALIAGSVFTLSVFIAFRRSTSFAFFKKVSGKICRDILHFIKKSSAR